MAPASASAEVQYGTLSNFDVFNDTGEETHGFEIELDGVSSSDITYTFGAPYQARYGTPTIENFAGGVYVRYASPYEPAEQSIHAGHTTGSDADHADDGPPVLDGRLDQLLHERL